MRAIILIENLSSVYAAKRIEHIVTGIMSNVHGLLKDEPLLDERHEDASPG